MSLLATTLKRYLDAFSKKDEITIERLNLEELWELAMSFGDLKLEWEEKKLFSSSESVHKAEIDFKSETGSQIYARFEHAGHKEAMIGVVFEAIRLMEPLEKKVDVDRLPKPLRTIIL